MEQHEDIVPYSVYAHAADREDLAAAIQSFQSEQKDHMCLQDRRYGCETVGER